MNKQNYYNGECIEKGKTSRCNNVSPAVKWLEENGYLPVESIIFDVGAGKIGRNAKYLRKQQHEVYAYDPYNFNTSGSGFDKGAISSEYPNRNFNIGLTCYVLNIVPKYEEENILTKMMWFCDKSYHIVRDTDFIYEVSIALMKGRGYTWEFYKSSGFQIKYPIITDEVIKEFCRYGIQTGKDMFQRFVILDSPFELIHHRKGKYRIYESK